MRLIVFDLDDTLFPEIEYVRSGFAAAAAAVETTCGILASDFFEECMCCFERGGRGRVFNDALVHLGGAESLVPMLIDAYRNHRPAIALRAGAPEMLSELRRGNIVAILSDGYLNVQRLKVEALRLDERVHRVLLTDAFGRDAWKPSPVCFERLVQWAGIPHAQAYYIGDNPNKDFVSPNRLGWTTIRLRIPDQLHFRTEGSGDASAKVTVTGIAELAEYLQA